MAISIACSSCRQALKAPDAATGRKLKCPRCGTLVAIPATVPPPPRVTGRLKATELDEPVANTSSFVFEETESPDSSARPSRRRVRSKSSTGMWLLVGAGGLAAVIAVGLGLAGTLGVFSSGKLPADANDANVKMPKKSQDKTQEKPPTPIVTAKSGATPASLIAKLKGGDAAASKAAINELGKLRPAGREVIDALTDEIYGPHWREAAEALSQIGPDAHVAIPKLFIALDNRREHSRLAEILDPINPAAAKKVRRFIQIGNEVKVSTAKRDELKSRYELENVRGITPQRAGEMLRDVSQASEVLAALAREKLVLYKELGDPTGILGTVDPPTAKLLQAPDVEKVAPPIAAPTSKMTIFHGKVYFGNTFFREPEPNNITTPFTFHLFADGTADLKYDRLPFSKGTWSNQNGNIDMKFGAPQTEITFQGVMQGNRMQGLKWFSNNPKFRERWDAQIE